MYWFWNRRKFFNVFEEFEITACYLHGVQVNNQILKSWKNKYTNSIKHFLFDGPKIIIGKWDEKCQLVLDYGKYFLEL